MRDGHIANLVPLQTPMPVRIQEFGLLPVWYLDSPDMGSITTRIPPYIEKAKLDGMVANDRIVSGALALLGLNTVTEVTIKQKRDDYSLALDSALRKIVAQLSQVPEVERVILFGSYAAGRRDLFIDLDLLVVMDSEQDFIHRTAELYTKIHTDVDMDLLAYTPDELMNNQDNGFIRRALETGQVVYEKNPT